MQYVAVDCGGACEGTHAVTQDVIVPLGATSTLKFGGIFASEGGNGSLTVAVHQMDRDDDAV